MAGKGSAKGERRGGRKKGTPNKSTAIREAEIAASGLTPMQYYLAKLRSNPPEDATAEQLLIWEKDRFAAARELMPYCHARLASVEANGSVEVSLRDFVAKLPDLE